MSLQEITMRGGDIVLMDVWGTDQTIADAARVSYDAHGRDRAPGNLLDYLMRHRHTSPFEMVETRWRIRAPIFVARQWHRHRTASINEISGRYVELDKGRWAITPDRMHARAENNKQGSSDQLVENAKAISYDAYMSTSTAYAQYQRILAHGVAPEVARQVLPLNTLTEWVWKIDLHNLFNFLELRMDSHAQLEIQWYAKAAFELLNAEGSVPLAIAAFRKHRLHAASFTKQELLVVQGFKSWHTLSDSQSRELKAKIYRIMSWRDEE